MQTGALEVVEVKSVSAVKKYPRAKRRGGENVQWQRIRSNADDLHKVLRIGKEISSSITRLVLFKHLTETQGAAAMRYAYIVARFEKYCVETRRNVRSPSYERAFGTDQEIERLRMVPDGIADYERRARRAKRDYAKLMKVLEPFADRITGRNTAKDVLDDLCLSDIEPASSYRQNLAIVLTAIVKAFGVTAQPRRNRRGRK